MVIVLLFLSVVLFVLADLAVRAVLKKIQAKKALREREEALAQSLTLDFSREAKTLKRAEVKDPAARLLCVDDEPVVLDSFRKILVLDGYCVDTVESGQEALGLIQTHHYDFLFTDLKMPEMGGVDVVKSVKHMRPDIDVVVITGYASVETAVECMKHGAMDYVQKPFTEDELRAFAKKALLRRQDRVRRQLKPQVHITHMQESAEGALGGEFSIPGGALISRGHCWAGMAQDGSVKVGLDDFANKLIGRVDAVEFPNVGMSVKAGQPLFSIRQGQRRAQFASPVGGKVVKVNAALGEDPSELELTPYYKNWVCVIDGDSLDADVPALKIGRSAVAFFQEEIERFRALRKDVLGAAVDEPIQAGELEKLDEARWERFVKEFFGR